MKVLADDLTTEKGIAEIFTIVAAKRSGDELPHVFCGDRVLDGVD
jgi:hypothetical protein